MNLHYRLKDNTTRFTPPSEREAGIRSACESAGLWADSATIGRSEGGRAILGVRLGRGPIRISLIAGAHADEPVGSEMLYWLITHCLQHRGDRAIRDLLDQVTFAIIPHINPDGEAANWAWIERFPDFSMYAQRVERELPGRDVEFGYPAMRGENKATSAFWQAQAPFNLHISLHGMSVAEGGMLLIERSIVEETSQLREKYREALITSGVGLHDHDRGGEKGFEYLGAGFQTTPEGRRMAAHFFEQGEVETAERFHLSSMEYHQQLSPRCHCYVTEIPLWRITDGPEAEVAGEARNYQALRRASGRGADAAAEPMTPDALVERFGLEPVSIQTAMQLQVHALDLSMDLVKQTRSG